MTTTPNPFHIKPTAALFACGHPNAGQRGPNGECVHPDHYRPRYLVIG